MLEIQVSALQVFQAPHPSYSRSNLNFETETPILRYPAIRVRQPV